MSISAVTQNSQTLTTAYTAPLKSAAVNNSLKSSDMTNLDNTQKKSAVDTVTISSQAMQLATQLKKA